MKLARPRLLTSLVRDSRGANMVEYVILVGLVAILALVGFRIFGSSVRTKISNQASTVQTAVQHNAN